MFKKLILVFLVISVSVSAKEFISADELMAKYPSVGAESPRVEDKRILCPFWRMVERSGALDLIKAKRTSEIMVSVRKITNMAYEFGCKKLGCGTVAGLVSVGQLPRLATRVGHVNLSKLHKATGVAHDCGFTFEKGGNVVSEVQRAETLARMKDIADHNEVKGQLSQEDLMNVKLQICAEQGVKISKAGEVEVGLIYSYLGGKDRGYILYSDVERLFHGIMPETKSIDGI